jgi:hypothetical protein
VVEQGLGGKRQKFGRLFGAVPLYGLMEDADPGGEILNANPDRLARPGFGARSAVKFEQRVAIGEVRGDDVELVGAGHRGELF